MDYFWSLLPSCCNQIREQDIQIHWKPPDVEGFKVDDVKGLLEQCCYPPSVEFCVSSSAPEFSEISIRGTDKKSCFFTISLQKNEFCKQGFNTSRDNRSDTRLNGGYDFENVSNDPLGEENLVDVVEKVMDLASRWNSFGLALRLKPAELETISSKNNTDPTECLKDMLLTWLRQQYIKKVGPPSWRMLCKAISVQVGGNNPALAKEIALTVVKQAAPMGDCITA